MSRTQENMSASGMSIERMCDTEDSPELRACAESAYRRGYTQGFHEAVWGMENDHSPQTLRDFLNTKLMQWRCKRHHGSETLPPSIVAHVSKGGANP